MHHRSIKDHPLYERIRQATPVEAASWVIGELPIEEADKSQRKEAFRSVARKITGGKAERTKYGFNSDTNGEIARAMEWAFQAGIRAGATVEVKAKVAKPRK
jgi:hypothetical protein